MSTPLFPSEWSKIWIRGTFINLDGTPMAGQVSFAANVTGKTMVASAAKKLIAARPLAVTLDGAGYFQIQIPATNDLDITPLNFTYTVAEPTGRTYSITVPWNTATLSAPGDPLDGQQVIDLTSVVPSPGASGGVGQLLRGVGIESIVNNPSGGLLVTYTDGGTATVSIPDAVKGDKGDPGEPGPASTVPGPPGAPGEVSAAQLESAIAALPFRANNTTTTGAAVGGLYALEVLGTNPTTFKLTAVTGGSGGTAVTVDGSAVSTLAIDSTPIGISDISGLSSALAAKLATADAPEAAQDAVAALLTAGTHTGITFTYNDTSNSLSAAVTAGGGSYSDEQAQDAVAALLAAGSHSGIQFTYDDAANKLSATVTASGGGTHPDDVLAAGEGTCSRRNTIVIGGTTTSGTLYLSYFTATRSEDCTQVRTFPSAAAAATPTLCRLGVYREDPSTKDLTLVASIPNDTTLWSSANSVHARSLSTTLSKIAGARYAVGHLVVSEATPPQFYGRQIGNSSFNAGIEATAPRLVGQVTGQADLPSTIAAASISNAPPRHVYAELVP